MYDATVQDAEGRPVRGRAYVGGLGTGAMWSSRIEMKLPDITLSDS